MLQCALSIGGRNFGRCNAPEFKTPSGLAPATGRLPESCGSGARNSASGQMSGAGHVAKSQHVHSHVSFLRQRKLPARRLTGPLPSGGAANILDFIE